MKITKKHKIPKKPIVIVTILLLLGGVGIFGFYQSQQPNRSVGSTTEVRPQNSVDYNPPTTTEQQQKEDTKTDVIKRSEQIKDSENTQPSTSANISVTLSRANQGGNGLPLNIRTIIVGATSGNCTVTLTRSGQPTVAKTFPITTQATYSTCQQADIPAADFSVGGEWQLSVTASNNSTISQPVTGSVNITK